MLSTLGLDIGGANLKVAHIDGHARIIPFELWRNPQRLADALLDLLAQLPACDLVAVTMTGELCDCYSSRREGVLAILDAVTAAAGGSQRVVVWRTDGTFTDPATARQEPLLAAAANWLALATWAGRLVPDRAGVLLDVGSTTTDIVPLNNAQPVPLGRTDFERLHSSELVYTGVWRTPLCSLLGTTACAELFATTLDVYLLLGEIAESSDTSTADGRAATRVAAHNRLARMLGGDSETVPLEEVQALARQAALYQRTALGHALRRVSRTLPTAPKTFLISGSGEFLARQVVQREFGSESHLLSLASLLGPAGSSAACAHALAVLARERCHV